MIKLIDPTANKSRKHPRENSEIDSKVDGLALVSVSLGFTVGLEIVFVGLDV